MNLGHAPQLRAMAADRHDMMRSSAVAGSGSPPARRPGWRPGRALVAAWLVAGAAVLAVPVSAAGTASVQVPRTWSGYLQVHVAGASLYALENVVSPGSEAVVTSTVWLAGPAASRTVRFRVGASDWTSCDQVAARPAQSGVITGYVCRELGRSTQPADLWIDVRS
jgi:hypothetical protein